MLMRIAEEYNKIDCNDPVVVLACSDRKSDAYKECPEICRPNGILTNNLTKTVEYKSNEISTKVVFNGTYTALKDGTIKRFTLKHDNIDQSNCQKNISFNDIIFKLYVN
jgi:hypothetical protein